MVRSLTSQPAVIHGANFKYKFVSSPADGQSHGELERRKIFLIYFRCFFLSMYRISIEILGKEMKI